MRSRGKLILLSIWLSFVQGAFASDCVNANQSKNMCKGYGFCTSFPLGKKDAECGGKDWSIPNNWIAMDIDCLSNLEKSGTYSCKNSGKVKIVICGKGNCYQCVCD